MKGERGRERKRGRQKESDDDSAVQRKGKACLTGFTFLDWFTEPATLS